MVTGNEAADANQVTSAEAADTNTNTVTSSGAAAERAGEHVVAKALLIVAAVAVAWGALGELSWYLSRLRWRWRRWYTDIAFGTRSRAVGRSKAGRR